MTKKLTTSKSPSNGFARGPGSQMGTKSRAILELLRKGKPRNALDIDMIIGMACGGAISRLVRMAYIRKSTYGSATGCYEITTNGRIALGESLSLAPPAYAPITGATMRDPYIPAIHNTSRIGVARA